MSKVQDIFQGKYPLDKLLKEGQSEIKKLTGDENVDRQSSIFTGIKKAQLDDKKFLLDQQKTQVADKPKSIGDKIKEEMSMFIRNIPANLTWMYQTSEQNLDKAPILGPIRKFGKSLTPSPEEARKVGMIKIGDRYVDPNFVGGLKEIESKIVSKVAPKIFTGFKDLTTKVLERLKGKSTTSVQEIMDFTNMPELKQAERDVIRKVIGDYKGSVPVQEFANKVKTELLPLKYKSSLKSAGSSYESTSLPSELRGPVANYEERVYESPIKTSAGSTHPGLPKSDNYFAHTRIEDLPTSVKGAGGKAPTEPTRRVIELQSDLFQKGNLENQKIQIGDRPNVNTKDNWNDLNITQQGEFGSKANFEKLKESSVSPLAKLEPYRNTWHERIIREEVKQAAKDGKTKLQFPTGETAMKIEGLGETGRDRFGIRDARTGGVNYTINGQPAVKIEDLKVGKEVFSQSGVSTNDPWIITDVLGDGKFKAVQKDRNFGDAASNNQAFNTTEDWAKAPEFLKETFDTSGKVDTNNPIFKFYEKEVGKYLTNKFGAKMITDPQGVKWWELNVPKSAAKEPILAYGRISPKSIFIGAGLTIAAGLSPLVDKAVKEWKAGGAQPSLDDTKSIIEKITNEKDFKFMEEFINTKFKNKEVRQELINSLYIIRHEKQKDNKWETNPSIFK